MAALNDGITTDIAGITQPPDRMVQENQLVLQFICFIFQLIFRSHMRVALDHQSVLPIPSAS